MTYVISRLLALCTLGIIATSIVLGYRGGVDVGGEKPRLDDKTGQVHVGEEFSLKVGQELAIEGERLRVKFVGVEEDSRCPSDVTCIWAGNAKLLLEVVSGKKCPEKLRLNTHGSAQGADEGKLGSLKVKLVKLDPYPRSNQRIAPGDYRATLVVSKE